MREQQVLTSVAFSRLLAWLDDGVESHGRSYLEIRRRLVAYFTRRNRPMPDELADETLNRIAKTLEEADRIALRPPTRYCYIIAKFVLLEDARRREHRDLRFDQSAFSENQLTRSETKRHDSEEALAMQEQRLACLDRGLQQLKPEQRELILEYYRADGRNKIDGRREMATRLGISMNALAVRASRIRSVLEASVAACCRKA